MMKRSLTSIFFFIFALAVAAFFSPLVSNLSSSAAEEDAPAVSPAAQDMQVAAPSDDKPQSETKQTAKEKGREKKVTFNFVDVEIPVVVKFISEVTGKNFVFDDKVKGAITIIAPSKLSMDEAFSLFTSVLELKGFTIVSSGKVYKIIPSAQAKQTGTEILKEEGAQVSDAYITRLIQLKSISSTKALNFLQPLVSRDGHISSFGPGNMLMVVDSATNVEKILKILEAIDRPGVEEPELVLLTYANAEDVAKILTETLVLSSKTQPASVRPPRPGETVTAASVEETRATVFADTRLNAIVLIADKQEKEAMKRIIALLDIPLPEATSKINVYFLEYADATELSKVLETMLSGVSTQARTSQAGQAGQPQKSPFEPGGKIIISPDKATNSLVIVASPADYQSLIQVIKQLDKRRKQVYVEAMIIEASIDNLRELGAQWRITAEKNNEPIFIGGFGTIDSTTVQSIISGLGGMTVGGMGNFLDIPITTTDEDGNPATSTLTIPGFAALFSLNEFRGAVNVLSTPQILTSDNKEAEIVVGENVPFISQRERDVTTSNTVVNSIERKDVGIKLRITPQITEGDYVKLDIYQEISAVKEESQTIVIISVGPTTTMRSTKTSVVVKDAQTVVIGGLMEERKEENVNKIPLLGDLPLIGWLFKNTRVQKIKTNLIVFLTPHIIKEADHLEKLTEIKKATFARAEEQYKEGELLVKFREDTKDDRISEILLAEGAAVIAVLKPKGLYHVRLRKGQDVRNAIKKFIAYDEIEYAEPNYVLKIQ
ncbi:MAG: type II secretion system secretin GspD [Nitrospirota bacterium]